MVSGCGKIVTYMRQHCALVHHMSAYIYSFFFLLIQSWDIDIGFTIDEEYVTFINLVDRKLLLKIRLDTANRRHKRRKTHTVTTLSKPRVFESPRNVSGEISDTSNDSVTSSNSSHISCSVPSVSPRNMRYPPKSVAGRLQKAGLYALASETLPEISGFRRSLHMAKGKVFTPKTLQLYKTVRKIYAYLQSRMSCDPFSEENIVSLFETLIACRLKSVSLTIWIKSLLAFVRYLVDEEDLMDIVEERITSICNKYTRRKKQHSKIIPIDRPSTSFHRWDTSKTG